MTRTLGYLVKKYLIFRTSVFGRVMYSIIGLSFILFLLFGVIFHYVHRDHLNTLIKQNGNNVGSMVENALYYSMLTNDKGSLKSTIDNINNTSGIDEVSMYDKENRLVYSSHIADSTNLNAPNCIECHTNMNDLFHPKDKVYRIVDIESACLMSNSTQPHRQLMIRNPILNQPSCSTTECHAHDQSDEVLGSLIIKMSLSDLDNSITSSSREFFLLASVITILMILSMFAFTSRKIRKPLNYIILASKAVADGDKTIRLEIEPNLLDDMKLVSEAFNNMLDSLHAANTELQNWSQQLEHKVQKKSEKLITIQKELIHIERIASLGKLSSSVAHEINNPLSGVLTYTKLVHKLLEKVEVEQKSKESMLKYLTIIETETKRCGDIVKSLLDFSRKDVENFEIRSLHKILSETYDLMAHQMKINNISFYTDFSAKPDLIYCCENQIKQACIAILVNASEAVSEQGEITFKTFNPDEKTIVIEIRDNGVGINPEDLEHVFEPFFTAKQKVNGVGLGLPIVHGLIQNHKGKIEIDSKLGSHTTVSIFLPLNNEKPE